MSDLHIDASVLPFQSLFLLHSFAFSISLGKGSLTEVERLLLLLMYDPILHFSPPSEAQSHFEGVLVESQRAFDVITSSGFVKKLPLRFCVTLLIFLSFLPCPSFVWQSEFLQVREKQVEVHSCPFSFFSAHTTVSLPFPGLIQPSPGALLPPRLALLSLSRRAEQRCQVWRVFADQIHMPDVMPTSSDMKIRSISDATYESRVLALNSPQ